VEPERHPDAHHSRGEPAHGRDLCREANTATGPVAVLIRGTGSPRSIWRASLLPPEASQAFIEALKARLRKDIPIIEMESNVNAPEFPGKVAETLLEMLA
jgi:uncharacterized protein (UPF0261 family)